MTDQEIFNALMKRIHLSIPYFSLRYKDESISSKIIAVLIWVFNRRYLQDFTTTRYPHVYFPSRQFVHENPRTAWKILAHEYVHLWDRKRQGRRFNLRYAFPQILAVFALPAIAAVWFSLWWLTALVFLLALLPLPSTGRRDIELRGYTMTMAVNYWRYGSVRDDLKDAIAAQFTGWGYYKMWPFKSIKDRLDRQILKLSTGSLLKDKNAVPFRAVYAVLVKAGYAK